MLPDLDNVLDREFPRDLIGRALSYRQVSQRLNRVLRPYGMSGVLQKDPQLRYRRGDRFDLSATIEERGKQLKIRVVVLVNDEKSTIRFTRHMLRQWKYHVKTTMCHEHIHRVQFKQHPRISAYRIPVSYTRPLAKHRLDEVNYYREWKEVVAYAHDLAMEIRHRYPNTDPFRIVQHIDQYYLWVFRRYVRVFRGLEWSHLRKKLLQYTVKWLHTTP